MENKKISNISILLIGSVVTLFIAPFLDEKLSMDSELTALTTLLFAGWIVYVVVDFVRSWRDDAGKWTRARAISKLRMYWEIFCDFVVDVKASEKEKRNTLVILSMLGLGLLLKALPNISVVIRTVLEWVFDKVAFLRSFELFGNTYYWIPLVIALIVFVCSKPTKNFIINLANEILNILQVKINITEPPHISSAQTKFSLPIINSKDTNQIKKIIKDADNQPITDLLNLLSDWSPKPNYLEWWQQDRLVRNMARKLKQYEVKSEQKYEFKSEQKHETKRFDIVFNRDTVLELKCGKMDSAVVQKAKGQIGEYLKLWSNNGPVILVLIDIDYNEAKEKFHDFIVELQQQNQPTFAIVVETVKSNNMKK